MTTVKTTKTKAWLRNDVYARLGHYTRQIEEVVKSMVFKGKSVEDVANVLDSYYEVANPSIHEALKQYDALRVKNARDVIKDGIQLHHSRESVDMVDIKAVRVRVYDIITGVGA